MLISEVPVLREYWYPVAYAKDVVDTPVPVRIFSEDYVLWRSASDQAVSAAVDECAHRAGRLSQGWVDAGCLVCPYHGWKYDRTGACVEIPQNDPDLPIPPRARTQPILAEERYGLVWVCVGVPRAHIPTLIEAEDAGYTLIHEMMEVWNASAPRVIDNALDVSHVAFVHKGTIGSAASPRLSDFKVARDGDRIAFSVSYTAQLTLQASSDVSGNGDGEATPQFVTRTTHAELVQPLVFRGVLEYESGLKHVLFKTATPVEDDKTLFCQFIARNDSPSADKQAEIAELDNRIQCEDRTLLERINPNFPIDVRTEIHTRADRMTVEFRRLFADLAGETSLVRPDSTWART